MNSSGGRRAPVRFAIFHAYCDCYGYLPLYVFCGRRLLAAKLRPSNIDGGAGAKQQIARIVAHVRGRWPRVRVCCAAIPAAAARS